MFGDHNKLVSIILPVFNSEAFLPSCLESILNQTYPHFELIIIDDGSIDNTPSIIDSYARLDKRIISLRNPNNLGIVESINRGIERASYEFVCRMDSDDVMIINRLEMQRKFLLDHPDIDVLGAAAELLEDGKTHRVIGHPHPPSIVHFTMFFNCCLVHPTVMLRRRVLDRVKYQNSFPHVEDLHLWLEIICETEFKIANMHEVVIKLRKHTQNVSHTNRDVQKENAISLSKKYMEQILKTSIDVGVMKCATFPVTTTSNSFEPETYYQLEKAVDLFEQLNMWFQKKSFFTITEKDNIKEECNKRIGQLVTIAMKRYPHFATGLWSRWLRLNPKTQLLQLLMNLNVQESPSEKTEKSEKKAITQEANKDTTGKSVSKGVCVITFSKDRAFQLKEYLRTFYEFIVKHSVDTQIDVNIIYKASSPQFESSYQKIKSSFPGVNFIQELSMSHQLQQILKSTKSEYVLFGVDDVLWFHNFDLKIASQELEKNLQVFCYHLKLHPSVNFCHPANSPTIVPPFYSSLNPEIKFENEHTQTAFWKRSDANFDWNYPWELCATLYRKNDVNTIVDELKERFGEFEGLGHPNRLEVSGNRVCAELYNQKPFSACPSIPLLCVITVNRVQSVCANRIYDEEAIDLDEMEKFFEQDKKIDTEFYQHKKYNSVHVGDFVLLEENKIPFKDNNHPHTQHHTTLSL